MTDGMKRILIKNKIKNEMLDYRELKDEYRNDYKITLEAVKIDGYNLQYASKKMKQNLEIIKTAILENKHSINFIDKKLKHNKEIINLLKR